MDQDDFFDDDCMEEPPDESGEDVYDDDLSAGEFIEPEHELDEFETGEKTAQPDAVPPETGPDNVDFGAAFIVGSMIAGNMYGQRRRTKKNG